MWSALRSFTTSRRAEIGRICGLFLVPPVSLSLLVITKTRQFGLPLDLTLYGRILLEGLALAALALALLATRWRLKTLVCCALLLVYIGAVAIQAAAVSGSNAFVTAMALRNTENASMVLTARYLVPLAVGAVVLLASLVVCRRPLRTPPSTPACLRWLGAAAFLLVVDVAIATRAPPAEESCAPFCNLSSTTPPLRALLEVLAGSSEHTVELSRVDESRRYPLVREQVYDSPPRIPSSARPVIAPTCW